MPPEKNILLQSENLLALNPKYINNTYGVLLNYIEKEITVHYEIKCAYKQYVDDSHFLFLLDRKQVFINNQLPEIKWYLMADEMAKAFYPLLLRININTREIINIENYAAIVERCKQTQTKLTTQYTGDIVLKSIRQFEKQYGNPNTIIKQVQNELFYKLFFFSIHKKYSALFTAITTFNFPFNTDKEYAPLNISHQIEPNYSSTNKIVVQLKSEQNSNISFEACYQLYADDHTISTIIGKAINKDTEGDVNTLTFEVHHLDAEKKDTPPIFESYLPNSKSNTESIIIESTPIKNKKKFWDIFK